MLILFNIPKWQSKRYLLALRKQARKWMISQNFKKFCIQLEHEGLHMNIEIVAHITFILSEIWQVKYSENSTANV